MSSQPDMEEEYLEEIPHILDNNGHEGSRKAVLLQALKDLLDECEDLPPLVTALPFVILAELWRDGPFNKTFTIASIGSYLCGVFGILAMLLFVFATIPLSEPLKREEVYYGPSITSDLLPQEIIDTVIDHLVPDIPLSEPLKREELYYGPSITDLLPQEIIDTIIDHLVPDIGRDRQICGRSHGELSRLQFLRAFSSYSLICRAFVRRSQFHLFSTLVIRSSSFMDIHNMDVSENDQVRGARLRSMIHFVDEASHLSKNISHLKISPSPQAYRDSGSDEYIQTQALLRALKDTGVEVRSLCLGFQFWAFRPIDDIAKLLLLSSVTSLHLHEVFGFPLAFVSMFPSLRLLSLSHFKVTDKHVSKGAGAQNDFAVPQIRSLVLKLASRELLRIMGMVRDPDGAYTASDMAFLDLSQLTRCDLVWTTDEKQNIASSVLVEAYGITITHFSYQFRSFPELPDVNVVNLEHLPALQELTIVFVPMWGIPNMTRTRLARTRLGEGNSPSGPSLDFIRWFLSNLHAEAPLWTLNITCPHMVQGLVNWASDPATLLLSLEWHRLDAEICRIYANSRTHNPHANSKFMLNLSFTIPLEYPHGVRYNDGVDTNREERLQWIEAMRRKCDRAMRSKLREQFPLIARCPGINLNIFYSLES